MPNKLNQEQPFSKGEGFGFLTDTDLEETIAAGDSKSQSLAKHSNKSYEHHKVLPPPGEDQFDMLKSIKTDCFESIRGDIADGYNIKNPMDEEEYLEQKRSWGTESFKRFTFHAPIELQERLRNLSYWTRMSVSDLGCHALALMIRQIEVDFNDSYPYRTRRHELKKGRKVN